MKEILLLVAKRTSFVFILQLYNVGQEVEVVPLAIEVDVIPVVDVIKLFTDVIYQYS